MSVFRAFLAGESADGRLKEMEGRISRLEGALGDLEAWLPESLENCAQAITDIRGEIASDKAPRSSFDPSPFIFLVAIFIGAIVVGFAVFAHRDRLMEYLAYVLPLLAALVAGAGLYFTRKEQVFQLWRWSISAKYDVICYQGSILILLLAFSAFSYSPGHGLDALVSLFMVPGFIGAVFLLWRRSRKSTGVVDLAALVAILVAWLLFIFGAVLLIIWIYLIATDGVGWIYRGLAYFRGVFT
ncbi:hypothetical protein [Xanthomonas arboricola]